MSYDPKLRAAVVEIIEDAYKSGQLSHYVEWLTDPAYFKKRKKQHLKQFFKLLREGETK